jgi:hypothetical protein
MQEILGTLPLASLEYHNYEGDYASWARTSLGDEFLAEKMNKLQSQRGERLRKSLLKAIEATLSERR